jgi:hypothetical protein
VRETRAGRMQGARCPQAEDLNRSSRAGRGRREADDGVEARAENRTKCEVPMAGDRLPNYVELRRGDGSRRKRAGGEPVVPGVDGLPLATKVANASPSVHGCEKAVDEDGIAELLERPSARDRSSHKGRPVRDARRAGG